MSLVAYQRALCDFVASPELCVRARRDSDSVLAGYDLTARERRRLATVVRQPGMSTSCTLYRVNRITPMFSHLPLTCFLLGDQLIPEAERFWAEGQPTDLQFGPETERFARHLRQRLGTGALTDPYLDEILEFELAVNRLRMASRELGDVNGRPDTTVPAPSGVDVRFRHEPFFILECLADRRRPESEPPDAEFVLHVEVHDGEVKLSQFEPL